MTATTLRDSSASVARRVRPNDVTDVRLERRISLIWLLLMLNVMPWIGYSILPLPQRASQLLTAGALCLALVLAVTLNRGLRVRPNLVLALFTVLAFAAVMAGLRGDAGIGAVLRSFRLCAFLAVLWLLTPWWGRPDLLLLKAHLRALFLVLATVVAGLLIAPSAALGASGGRLSGVLWPIPAPQVGAYAAVVAGTVIVLWLSGSVRRRPAVLVAAVSVALVFLSHTRTALVALLVGVVSGGCTLLLSRQRARRVAIAALVLAPVFAALLAPALVSWFFRDQSPEEISALTGRKQVWEMVLAEPRSEFTQLFGRGLSDKSFAGLSIDSSWLAVYHEQGLLGNIIMATILAFLLVAPAFRATGPARGAAVFLVIYCAVASYTEVTFGDASPYLLHIVVAASLIVPRVPHPRPHRDLRTNSPRTSTSLS